MAARDTERGRDPRLVGAGQIECKHLPEGRLIGFGARTDERNEQPENPEHRQQPAQGAALFGMRVGLIEVSAGAFLRRSGQAEGAEDHLWFQIVALRPGYLG